uniref:Uncharacterized protein n=1 Tax=Alexandrium monilatum TaxID=311494 RepID=A0A7S4VH72_9DINO|mmetsp:Transcript_92760/g.294312  ORF Transcript_92760/g.294312 Transcript_92760/m.294312 type:complete len:204 (+) Transcript_92760:77-688(+)
MADEGKGAGRGTGGYGGLFGGLKDLAKNATAQAATAAAAVASTAQERIEIAQGGKKMLDTGGPVVQNMLLAKKTANDAVTLDRSVVAKLTDAAMIYEEAAQKMKASSTESAGGGAATNEVTAFNRMAAAYEARAAALKVALETLNAVPEAPEISPVEQDAISILVAKGQYRWVATKTAEGFNTLRRRSADAASSAATAASCPA